MPNDNKDKDAVLVIAGMLCVIFLFLKKDWLIYSAVVMILLSVLSTWVTAIIAKGWFGIASILGKINATILLFLVFYLLVVPLSFILKIMGKKIMQVKLALKETTSFKNETKTFVKKDFENPW